MYNNFDSNDFVLTSSYYSQDWEARTSGTTSPYICEWSAHNYISVASVPDMNNNGYDETAVLYVDYITAKHSVAIRDGKKGELINTLTFATDLTPPQGVVVLADINGNDVPEIGVLFMQYGQPAVGIKDANDNKKLLNTLRFLSPGTVPVSMTTKPDSNDNGATEITVLGQTRVTTQ